MFKYDIGRSSDACTGYNSRLSLLEEKSNTISIIKEFTDNISIINYEAYSPNVCPTFYFDEINNYGFLKIECLESHMSNIIDGDSLTQYQLRIMERTNSVLFTLYDYNISTGTISNPSCMYINSGGYFYAPRNSYLNYNPLYLSVYTYGARYFTADIYCKIKISLYYKL